MVERSYRVGPSQGLQGTIVLQGAKNSVLKLMAATLLAPGVHRLSNVPRLLDVTVMQEILDSIGVTSRWIAVHELEIRVPEVSELGWRPPLELVSRIRASVVLLGPLLASVGSVELALPGGDDFGVRPIDIHEDGLSRLGAEFHHEGAAFSASAKRLVGREVVLEFPSHTATDNMLMAAVKAEGITVVDNAAREPEVVDLANALISMGARIQGAGTSRIVIEGVKELSVLDGYRVIGDRVVAATYLTALGMAGGELRIEGIDPVTMEILLRKLGATGVEIEREPMALVAAAGSRPRAADIQTLPYPGVATDYKPMLVAMLSRASGVSVVSENLFSGRFRYLEELRRFGADLISEGHHVIVRGVERLTGAEVGASDIRAGAALVVAALGAESQSRITGVYHIERGYDHFAETLQACGAAIEVEEGVGE
ncbi:MAG: UDP-N-acetylglucosamine 1-carboxyvinyltransferase [Ferrimicrobium sp.]